MQQNETAPAAAAGAVQRLRVANRVAVPGHRHFMELGESVAFGGSFTEGFVANGGGLFGVRLFQGCRGLCKGPTACSDPPRALELKEVSGVVRSLVLNMFCQYIHLWMYVVTAADFYHRNGRVGDRLRREPRPVRLVRLAAAAVAVAPGIKHVLSVHLPVDVCNTCG